VEKVIFVDRDGVINVDLMGYVEKPADFRFEEGAVQALKKLYESGYKIIVISNQAGVGDGVFTSEACWDVHKHMLAELAKEGIDVFSAHYCLHGKKAGCACRKPEIGLFKEAEKRIAFNKKKTFFIGDKATDIEAGKKYGIKTAFVRTGHGRNEEKMLTAEMRPEIRGDNLLAAVHSIFDRYHSGPSKRKQKKPKTLKVKKPGRGHNPKPSTKDGSAKASEFRANRPATRRNAQLPREHIPNTMVKTDTKDQRKHAK